MSTHFFSANFSNHVGTGSHSPSKPVSKALPQIPTSLFFNRFTIIQNEILKDGTTKLTLDNKDIIICDKFEGQKAIGICTYFFYNYDTSSYKCRYTGPLNENLLPEGEGVLRSLVHDSFPLIYQGEWKNGHYHGEGTVYRNGIIWFKGTFINNSPYNATEFFVYYDEKLKSTNFKMMSIKNGRTTKISFDYIEQNITQAPTTDYLNKSIQNILFS